MMHLRALQRRQGDWPHERYPFSLPILQDFASLEFRAPLTFLVGDNGSGKSTILEALACVVGLPTVGSAPLHSDPTLQAVHELADELKAVWNRRTRVGFFLRAEDFFGYVKRLSAMNEELVEDWERTEVEYADRSPQARGLARMAYARELKALKEQYGEGGLSAASHGESYLQLFQARFRPGGLYLLDEPEAPLAPLRQLAFVQLLHQSLAADAQFVIATHSPILLAYPEAAILSCDGGTLREVAYDALEAVLLLRDFLNEPTNFLHHLLKENNQSERADSGY